MISPRVPALNEPHRNPMGQRAFAFDVRARDTFHHHPHVSPLMLGTASGSAAVAGRLAPARA
jgi:hypothetical protein